MEAVGPNRGAHRLKAGVTNPEGVPRRDPLLRGPLEASGVEAPTAYPEREAEEVEAVEVDSDFR